MDKSSFNVDFQNADLSSKIVSGLERISEAYKVLLWDHAKVIGLSPIQIHLLIFLRYHHEDHCNVSALAKEFNVTKPTISDAVKVLDKKGMIKKITSPIDKRAYSITLTKVGKKTVAATEHFANPIKKIVDQCSKKEQVQFFDTLSRVIYQLNQTGVLQVQRTCYSCKFHQKKAGQSFCKLLDQTLRSQDIRLDCPEFAGKD